MAETVAYAKKARFSRLPFARVLDFKQIGLLLVVIALWSAVAVLAPRRFVNLGVQLNYFKDTSIIAIMAVGMTAVIISAGIDLSVGSIYALAAVCGAMVLRHYGPTGAGAEHALLGTLLGIGVTLGVAGLCGLLNGVAVVGLRVHPFIITLGGMLIYRGLAFVTTKATSIGYFPRPMTDLMRTDLRLESLGFGAGIQPMPMIVMLAVAAVGIVYLSATVAGRNVYAVGGNLETARFSGLRTNRIIMSVYVLVGLCAGISAVVANGIYGSASSAQGEGYELRVIAAAVVGGASLAGGRGSALGALLGAALIQLIVQAIITLRIDQNYQQIIIGSAIIVAVVLDQISRRTTERRAAAAAVISESTSKGDSQ